MARALRNGLVFGIGIFEKGKHKSKIGGVRTTPYAKWLKMIDRCNPDGEAQTRQHTYIGCTIHPDFIKYQDFAEWLVNQPGSLDWHLDKDLIVPGNKVYGPDTCALVPREINTLFLGGNGSLMLGVVKKLKRYVAKMANCGNHIYIGSYATELEAHVAYRLAKANVIECRIAEYPDIDCRILKVLNDECKHLRDLTVPYTGRGCS
ncbi:hypothetical protein D3C75_473970 [compost metagenome]